MIFQHECLFVDTVAVDYKSVVTMLKCLTKFSKVISLYQVAKKKRIESIIKHRNNPNVIT